MREFTYERASDPTAAAAASAMPGTMLISGGTNLLDLMKLGIERPSHLVDIRRLPLHAIDDLPGGGLRIGSQVDNATLAADLRVRARYPVLSEALLAGASAQLRNKASTGGNLLQRTRCLYFYDTTSPCNKRAPGAGCSAIGGFHRSHAILGASESCIATHPSDMAVAMAVLDARIEIVDGRAAAREVAIGEFYAAPGTTPHVETVVRPGELITAVVLPPPPRGAQRYRKVRDRASYEFALVSVAVVASITGETIDDARVAFGGVAHKPWRSHEAETALRGRPRAIETYRAAADAALASAIGLPDNAFKIELAKRTLIATLARVCEGRS